MFFGGSMQHRKQSLLCYIVFLLNSHKELEGKKLKKEKEKEKNIYAWIRNIQNINSNVYSFYDA